MQRNILSSPLTSGNHTLRMMLYFHLGDTLGHFSKLTIQNDSSCLALLSPLDTLGYFNKLTFQNDASCLAIFSPTLLVDTSIDSDCIHQLVLTAFPNNAHLSSSTANDSQSELLRCLLVITMV